MHKTLNWKQTEEKARRMTDADLHYARLDCQDCIRQGVDAGYYADESSVYKAEQDRRRGSRSVHVFAA